MIRPVELSDAGSICGIYNPYVADTIITFEKTPVAPEEMAGRIKAITADFPWLVACDDGVVQGYAYASKWRTRTAYRYSVEATVYVERTAFGNGIGTALYSELLAILKGKGLHAVIGVIALPNPASVALHEKMGFRKVGHFPEVGWKFEQWIDVGFWQRLL